jgi:hypothetical protein
MKSLICEMPLDILEIKGPHNSLTSADADFSQDRILLPAYDNFSEFFYDDSATVHMKKSVLVDICIFLEQTMPSYIKLLPTYDIILIERTDVETYYNKVKGADLLGSGASLRCIGNHAAIVAGLSNKYGSKFANISLERYSFYYQFYIFNNAKVVIAQHGAALSNIIFMKNNNGAKIIEIKPPADYINDERLRSTARAHFRNLSKYMKFDYTCINQINDFADISVKEIIDAINPVL